MKSNVLKIGLPLAVVAFGLASAASTSAISTGSKPFARMGYTHINDPQPCQAVWECDENGDFNCKAPDNVTQLYSLESNCNIPLKRSVE